MLVATVAIYACMVLIGRRHWTGGKDGNTMAWHYLARILALVVVTVAMVLTFRQLGPVPARHHRRQGQFAGPGDEEVDPRIGLQTNRS